MSENKSHQPCTHIKTFCFLLLLNSTCKYIKKEYTPPPPKKKISNGVVMGISDDGSSGGNSVITLMIATNSTIISPHLVVDTQTWHGTRWNRRCVINSFTVWDAICRQCRDSRVTSHLPPNNRLGDSLLYLLGIVRFRMNNDEKKILRF